MTRPPRRIRRSKKDSGGSSGSGGERQEGPQVDRSHDLELIDGMGIDPGC